MAIKIRVSYQGPTDTRGARIIARGGGKQKSILYNYSLNTSERYLGAAMALAKTLGMSEVKEDPSTGDDHVFIASP